MANLNKVMIIGNLTADPELRQTPRGTPVTELRLAVNRYIGGGAEGGERREETTFLDVTCWSRLGEIAATYLQKGRPVFIEGRLQMDSWEDKQTGQKRSRIRIVAENLQLLGGRDGAAGAPNSGGNGNYRQNNYNNSGGGYQENGGYNNSGGGSQGGYNGGGNGAYNGGGSQGGYNGGGNGAYNGGGSQGGGSQGGYRDQQSGYQQPPSRPAPSAPLPEEDDDIPF